MVVWTYELVAATEDPDGKAALPTEYNVYNAKRKLQLVTS